MDRVANEKIIDGTIKFYNERKNIEFRIKLGTQGPTGKLITHNFRKIVELLSPYENGEKIIDAGCGWGYLMSFLPENIDMYALDINLNMLHASKKCRKDFTMMISDAQKMSIKDDTFDKLFSIGVTGHIPDVRTAICEMYRILKPGGMGVINFTNKLGLMCIPNTIFNIRFGAYYSNDSSAPLDDSFTYFEAKNLLRSSGFDILGSYGGGIPFPYSLGEKIPGIAYAWNDIMMKTQDYCIVKHLSTGITFKIRKPEGL